ncbi:TonB-dependent receptor [Mangrovimonas sp. AS39]|uniref:SusC/RagA family TonB-linked outer membrane protein n=1 Tax=Mangrovimonas futianensis TaxID=2895523 RepID=UPI001E4E7F66|nr:TonB-dependent receptor [Mangrovimonas futianensis]MCF1190901.1 TonB-dependent receptor [Mangrovimonas futianensis]MCF1194597.1 TonB-dependent receptor [Mangrovimonas futianensis]MCF1420355.1 TonB-dependent receptor [Mangrovimonas futianensis]
MITTKLSIGNHLNSKLKHGLFLMILFLLSASGFAQQKKTITGTVTSPEDNLPLPGVNVIIKGTTSGVATDFDGNYAIEAASNDILVFSFIGFQTKEVPVGDKSVLNISLEENVSALNEIVVVGYGTKKKSDLTGSVSVVDVEDAQKTITYDVAKMIQGQAPGVTVQSSGEPGGFVNIKIRGITSFRNNNPLFVIDGVIVNDPYDFPTGDIESIQILKDASSAAIYGARGANGVVIITTKKGKEGKVGVSYKNTIGFQDVPENRWYSMMNREEYQRMIRQAETNNPNVPITPGNYPESDLFINDVDTDWQDEAFRTGMIENHTITFNGGAEALNYNANFDYFKNTSYMETPQAYERYNGTININGEKGRFKYGSKLTYSQSDKENFNEYLAGTSSMINLLQAIPTMPVYDPNRLGGYGGADNLTQKAITLNVIGYNNLITNTNERNRFVGNVWGELEILKGLKYKISVSADKLHWNNRYYNPASDLGWYYITTPAESRLDVNTGSTTRTILNNLLSYDVTLAEKHQISLLAGMIEERNDFQRHFSRGIGFEPGSIPMLQYATDDFSQELKTTETYKSYISRLDYTFADKYLLTANFRQDRSSKFAPKNNVGNYFSVSGAWKVHEEEFINFPSWWNTLKLRGGYGQLGNNTIGLYEFAQTVNAFAGYVFGDTEAPGSTVVKIVDPDIKWEDTESTNVAAEFGFFDNKLQFSAEWFKKRSTDLLADVPIPYSSGSFPIRLTTNAGTVQNTGLEFTLSYGNSNKDFKYNISANLGTLKNEVLKIGNDDTPITDGVGRTEVGRSAGELFAYETEGLFQSQEDIDNHAFQPNAAPGDVKFRDVNGDGLITDADRTFQGTVIPKLSYGLNFSCSYKALDFSMFFQGAAGHKIYNGTYNALMTGDYVNNHTDMNNYWTPNNTNTDVPRPVIGDPNANNRASDRFIEDGDFVRLQSLELGYNIPLPENKILQRARVFASGQNLFVITNYSGYDPDFISNGLFNRGFEFGSFPNPRTIAFGVQVDF